MRGARVLPVIALLGIGAPAGVHGQGVRVDFVPTAGWTRPSEALGSFVMEDQAWYVNVGRAASSALLGAAAELTLPASRFGARITGFATLPGAADTFFGCRPGLACPAILLESSAEVSTLNGLADLVFAIGTADAVKPWVAAGVGFRRYDISWRAPAGLLDAGSHAETVAVLHAAAGVDISLAGGTLRAEVGNLWSGAGDRIGPFDAPTNGSANSVPGRGAQSDLMLSLGWRLLSF